MKAIRRSLSLRLALLFALVSALILGTVCSYLYQSLSSELAWRDDQTLRGRLDRMHSLLDGVADIDTLKDRPQLYANMLGNTDNMLWVIDARGQVLIEINPPGVAVPDSGWRPRVTLKTIAGPPEYRAAGYQIESRERPLTLVAGRLLAEREAMLGNYRLRLTLGLAFASLAAFGLGWLVSHRGLRPLRRLARQSGRIDTQHLSLRLSLQAPYSELQALTGSLNAMLDRLQAGFEQLSRFSEDLAHEMRTPLNNLIGQSQQCLTQSRSAAEYETLLESNLEEFDRLNRMMNSMLFLARNDQPDARIQPEWIELPAAVDALCDYFADLAEDRQLTLVNATSGRLKAQPDLLRRALANLLANALREADAGTEIVIGSDTEGPEQCITVQNSGPAIPEGDLPHLFERFFRGDRSRSDTNDSGGLGLAIVRSIMALHRGRVEAANIERGVAFALHFPAPGPDR